MGFSKRNSLIEHTARATAALGLATATSIASAMPLNELFFSQLSGFGILDSTGEFPVSNVEEFNAANPNSAGDSVAGTTTFEQISWKGSNFIVSSALFLESFTSESAGTPGATPAGLRFTPGFAGVDVDGQWNEGDIWAIDTLTHWNNEISGGQNSGNLWVGDTIADFSIFTDAVGGNQLVTDPDSRSEFSFNETLNFSDECPTPSPFFDDPGRYLPNLPVGVPAPPGCDDFFDGTLDTSAIGGVQDGFLYEIGFTLIPGKTFIGTPVPGGNTFTELGDVLICGGPFVCDAELLPGNPGQLRVYTPEYGGSLTNDNFGVSQISIAAFWRARQIPAPAPLALIGTGLLGLTLRGARKKRAA